jgi:hypothetical protein
MKCQHCNTVNPDDAKYCRVCGNVLTAGTVLDRFPNLGLIPISLLKLRSSFWAGLVLCVLILPLAYGCFLGFGGIIMLFVEGKIFNLFISACGFLGCFLLYVLAYKSRILWKAFPNYYVKKKLLREAEYIQQNLSVNNGYVFIIKNYKFGIYNTKKNKVQIPAEYDLLSWVTEGEILNVQHNGRQYIMDIYGNELR